MAHEIELPYDQVLSTQGTEWHGLATVVEEINEPVLDEKGLFFPIQTGEVINHVSDKPLAIEIAEIQTAISNGENASAVAFLDKLKSSLIDTHRTVTADLRECRPDLKESGESLLVPLHVPKASYTVIENRAVFNTVKNAFPGCPITSAGTLQGLKVFFMSIDIGNAECVGPRGDKFKQYLDCLTSHNGTIATKFYDSGTRCVCMNTVKASLQDVGELDFTVYHSSGAENALKRVSASLDAILENRALYFTNLEFLDTISIDTNEAKLLAIAYLTQLAGEEFQSTKMSTQVYNRATEIAFLFQKGQGNKGANLYDLYNGLTECFTWGIGVGAKNTKQEKFIKSQYGTAQETKENFLNYLLMPDGTRELEMERAQKLLIDYELVKSK